MKFCVYTLGCKVNYYESESIVRQLKELGEVTTELEVADIYIINTCAVTNEAEHKSRGVIAKVKKLNPDAKIYIMGCSSQLHANDYINKPNVVLVQGSENKQKVVQYIKDSIVGQKVDGICSVYDDDFFISGERIRSFIKIQDGCNNFCTYCIIPYVRGRERSRSLESIEKELQEVAKNSLEVVLVGINIAGYGKDLNPQRTLVDVVRLFEKYPNLRLRFSSFEMGTITDELLTELKALPSFCPFFHIALQSGSDQVLNKMNRHYTTSEYLKTIEMVRKVFPDASISTDIIVGFPTETEEDFNNSLNFVKKCNFSFMHIFPYSKREGTIASRWGILNGQIVKNRVKKMKELEQLQKLEFLKSRMSTIEEVLVESVDDGVAEGFTKTYIKCYILNVNESIKNKIVKVRLIEEYKDGMKGEIF